MKDKNTFTVIDGETLMDMRLEPNKFCVDTLLPQGIGILGGASKIGKSWLVLDLCVRIAKGEAIWNLNTNQGTTLYLCLEDTLRRVQERLNMITDEVPSNAYFAISAGTIADGLCDQIRAFVGAHPDTVFVAIDTFQVKEQTSGAEQFVNLARKYTNITELTPEILNTMIDKIVIGERESKHAKKGVKQRIRILFKGFGELDDLMCV